MRWEWIRALAGALLLAVPLAVSCGPPSDYDIEEIAPSSHTGDSHHHHAEAGDADADDDSPSSSTSFHVHEPGVRNHGTQWFFNQPWAASFVWPKMIRDSVILLVLATLVYLFSRKLSRRT